MSSPSSCALATISFIAYPFDGESAPSATYAGPLVKGEGALYVQCSECDELVVDGGEVEALPGLFCSSGRTAKMT
jgi:hypothetical protein